MRLLCALLALPLLACTSTQQPSPETQVEPASPPGIPQGWAKLGESVTFDIGHNLHPIIVTPIELLSDSRCPSDVQCIWAGELRVTAQIDQGGPQPQVREFVLPGGGAVDESQWYGLTLVDAQPYPASNVRIALDGYRFRFVLAPETIIVGPSIRRPER